MIANDNSEAQVVLSGSPEAVGCVSEALTCKRAIPLAVSGAFHSPFMADAAEAFSAHLDTLTFADARVPVLSNTDPTPSSDGSELKQRLRQQMTTGVRWRETMEALTAAGSTPWWRSAQAMCSVASQSVRCVASPATSWPMPAISAFERAQLQDHNRRRCCRPGLPARPQVLSTGW